MANYIERHHLPGSVGIFLRIMLQLRDVSHLCGMASLLFPKPLAKGYFKYGHWQSELRPKEEQT